MHYLTLHLGKYSNDDLMRGLIIVLQVTYIIFETECTNYGRPTTRQTKTKWTTTTTTTKKLLNV